MLCNKLHDGWKMIKNKEYRRDKSSRAIYLCECDSCGDKFERRSDIKTKIDAIDSFSICSKCSNKIAGEKRKLHGETMSNSRLYVVWQNMRRRCLDSDNARYKKYGGRGVKICSEWSSYIVFSKWARANGYRDYLTIDRIDNDGGYNPKNCRFVDKSYQNANRGAIKTNNSGFVGVWYKAGRYQARIQFKGVIHNVGRFHSLIAAVRARDEAILELGYPNQLSGIERMRLCDIEKQDREYREYLRLNKGIK